MLEYYIQKYYFHEHVCLIFSNFLKIKLSDYQIEKIKVEKEK